MVYDENNIKNKVNSDNKIAIDLGINNLCAITSNIDNSFIINGKALKSMNYYYNKQLAKLKSDLKKNHNKESSKRIERLTLKRNNKVNDYLHKTSKYIIEYCKEKEISEIAIGYNDGWKQGVNLNKQNNQNFVGIPHKKLIEQIKYKAELNGISIHLNNESYTSKVSALDKEKIMRHNEYLGERIKRGLFKTKDGILINSDINGSLNIGRKVWGDDYVNNPTLKGFVMNPIKVNPL